MLRHLSFDIKQRSYAEEASRLARPDEKIFQEIQKEILKKHPNIANSLRSVMRTKNTLLVRATSPAAASALFTASSIILEVAERAGIGSVRFMV